MAKRNKNKNQGNNRENKSAVNPEEILKQETEEAKAAEETTEEVVEEVVEEVTESSEMTEEEAEQAAATEAAEKASKDAKAADKKKKRYEVQVSVLGGKNNKMFNHKDKVTADQLNGKIEDLIEAGYIK